MQAKFLNIRIFVFQELKLLHQKLLCLRRPRHGARKRWRTWRPQHKVGPSFLFVSFRIPVSTSINITSQWVVFECFCTKTFNFSKSPFSYLSKIELCYTMESISYVFMTHFHSNIIYFSINQTNRAFSSIYMFGAARCLTLFWRDFQFKYKF
jgi:hypothetical protein